MSRNKYLMKVVFVAFAALVALWLAVLAKVFIYTKTNTACSTVTIAIPGPVEIVRVDGSTIRVNEKEFTLPAGDTRFTVRVMDSESP